MTEEQKEMRYVCFKTPNKVYGINVCDLLSPPKEDEAVVSWDSLPPLPAAFKADLPAFCTHLVEFDSSFYLLGGVRHHHGSNYYSGSTSLKSFQLNLEEDDEKQKLLSCKEVGSIPKPPMCYGIISSEHVKIRGDYYFIAFDPKMPIQAEPDSFWVLRSRSQSRINTHDWNSLPPPPFLGVRYRNVTETQYFVFGDKIYFRTIYVSDEAHDTFISTTPTPSLGGFESVLLYSFDPFQGDGTWTKHGEADKFIDSFIFNIQDRLRIHCPIVTLPLPGIRDYSLHLSTSHIEKSDLLGEWEYGYKAILHALIVNKDGVRVVQKIEGLFDGIQPEFHVAYPTLVYLGNNMVCAMLIGFAKEHHNCRCPLVCVSLFHLSIIEDVIDMDHINSDAPQKVQIFLNLKVKSKHVYSMVDYLKCILSDQNLYSFTEEIEEFLWESSDLSLPLSPVPKRPKL